MTKVRIVERTGKDGSITYTIQHRYFLFPLWWVDACVGLWDGGYLQNTWDTLEEAKANLPFFDGTRVKQKVVYER
jgi:hypothetical protein